MKVTHVVSFIAALAVLSHEAAAQQQLNTQDAYFTGTCDGTDQSFSQLFSTPFTGTVTGADIQIFQGASTVQHGFASLSTAGVSSVVATLGPGESHITSFPGGGDLGAAPYYGTGFHVITTSMIGFDIACTSGAWQAFVTYWYHTP